jgi:hypothetical protein
MFKELDSGLVSQESVETVVGSSRDLLRGCKSYRPTSVRLLANGGEPIEDREGNVCRGTEQKEKKERRKRNRNRIIKIKASDIYRRMNTHAKYQHQLILASLSSKIVFLSR